MHLTVNQNRKMKKMKINGQIELRITLRMNVLESKIAMFRSFTKQSMERNTVVASVVYFTGLNIYVMLSGSLKFMLMDTDTI